MDTQSTIMQMISSSADAQKKRLLIADGLAVDEGDTALDVMRLRVFALDEIQTAAAAERSAAHVLLTVREGFLGIQDEAREAEQSGELSRL